MIYISALFKRKKVAPLNSVIRHLPAAHYASPVPAHSRLWQQEAQTQKGEDTYR